MPTPPAKRTPKFRHHKGSGQGFVELDGQRIYLGVFGRPETEQKYHRMIAEYLANGRTLPVAAEDMTVVELVARFWTHCKSYYRHPDGRETDEVASFRLALRPLKKLYGTTRVSEFGPRRLKTVRQRWIDKGMCRTYINQQINRVRHMFKWGVEEELVEPHVLHRLQAVKGLKRGRTEARESQGVTPVPAADIDAVRPFVSRQVWALIQLQLLTGARSSELVKLRPVDLDMTTHGQDGVWICRLAQHKNAHRGHDRTIYFGPRAQEVIKPFLVGKSVDSFLFSPAEAEAERLAKRHALRVVPIGYGNRPGTNKKSRPQVKPRDHYDRDSYRKAIHRACGQAEVSKWSPHRLRHSAGTEVRADFGVEGAQLILGHKRADVSQVYAESNQARAIEIAAMIG